MAQNQQKRQQKLAKKKRRTNEIKKDRNKRLNISSREIAIQTAQRAPWVGCFVHGQDGMHSVMAIRQSRSDAVAAVFLVDSYCLGIKESFLIRSFDLEAFYERTPESDSIKVSPEHALKFVEDAVAYGRSIGFEPSGEYAVAKLLFGDTDSAACLETFVFGKDGKPSYISDKNDSRPKQRLIFDTLSKLGDGNFDFVQLSDHSVGFDHFRHLTEIGDETDEDLYDQEEDEEYGDDDLSDAAGFDDGKLLVIDAVNVRPAQ
jgi:hypothetical protein